MRNKLMLTAAGSALALAVSHLDAATVSPGATVIGSETAIHYAQKGEEKGAGARQDGGAKGAESGSKGREPGMGQEGGGQKGAARPGQDQGQGQRERGAAGEQREKGAQTREKGAREGQRSTDVNVRGGRDGGSRVDRRTRVDIDIEPDRGRRAGGRDVNIRERERGSYGYTSGNCQQILQRYKQCVGR